MAECNPTCEFRLAAIAALNEARDQVDALRAPVTCTYRRGSLKCTNPDTHRGEGHGCVLVASSHPDDRTNRDGRRTA